MSQEKRSINFSKVICKNDDAFVELSYVKIGNGEKIILITAGMDGDEYASMAAANDLINWYLENNVSDCSIYIFPLVNIPGFNAGESQNPVDGLYPKHIYPGNLKGTLSERMIATMLGVVPNVSLWIDLHGGARYESLTPFVWGFETKVKKIDELTKRLLQACNASISLYTPWNKATKIAKKGCCYLIFESGDRGLVEDKKVELHVSWVKRTIEAFIYPTEKVKNEPFYVYTKTTWAIAPKNGYWQVKSSAEGNLEYFEGELQLIKPLKKIKILTKKCGLILWSRIDSYVTKGQELCVQAHELKPTIRIKKSNPTIIR